MTETTRAPRRDAAANREALLVAARRELNTDPDASLDAIAASAGLSRRAVYGHFATREELLRELVTSGAARISAALSGVEHDDPIVRIALVAGRLWREVADIRVMALLATRGPLQVHTARGLEPIRARAREAIADGVARGTVRGDIPPERLARLLEDAMLGALAETTRGRMSAADAHRLVMLLALSTVGLGHREAGALIDSHPELAWRNA